LQPVYLPDAPAFRLFSIYWFSLRDFHTRWNEISASAELKKFRQITQEYTLDVLLGYTNVQLDMLSKRYVLQRIPGSLGLQVVDQGMGNEVRTVNSLSGGECWHWLWALPLFPPAECR
jgi:exonuclease SbcC